MQLSSEMLNNKSANTILFRASIVHKDESIYASKDDGADYLDLNHNGRADFKDLTPTVIWRANQAIDRTEPALTLPLRVLREAAQNGGHGEVITADKLQNVKLEDVHLSNDEGGSWHNARTNNPRSLATLIPQYAPLDSDATYGIDLRRQEFVIYRPEGTPAPSSPTPPPAPVSPQQAILDAVHNTPEYQHAQAMKAGAEHCIERIDGTPRPETRLTFGRLAHAAFDSNYDLGGAKAVSNSLENAKRVYQEQIQKAEATMQQLEQSALPGASH